MVWIRSEEEVDKLIDEMLKRSNGKYITQSVTFKKDDTIQMELLKKALMSSTSFSSFIKQILSEKFDSVKLNNTSTEYKQEENIIPKKNTGNFLWLVFNMYYLLINKLPIPLIKGILYFIGIYNFVNGLLLDWSIRIKSS